MELVAREKTAVIPSNKPFDVLAEGLVVKKIGATGFEPVTSSTPS
jgi:hypothetical protein